MSNAVDSQPVRPAWASDVPTPIELSIYVPVFADKEPHGWNRLFESVMALDVIGVDRLVISDHVAFGEHMDEYARPEVGGTRDGVQPTGPDGHWLEPLTTLSVMAGMTTRIRLGTEILLAALRRPIVLAKSTATLDVLSGGRLEIGVGVGWQREEYEVAGLTFEDRGQLLDHSLEVCQVLWRERRASYSSPYLYFDGIHMMPKPAQSGGVPIWIGGTVNARSVRRLARFGSGWIPWGDAARDVASGAANMRHALSDAGYDPAGLRIVGGLRTYSSADGSIDVDRTMEPVPALIRAGVTDFRPMVTPPKDLATATERLLPLLTAFWAAVGRSDQRVS